MAQFDQTKSYASQEETFVGLPIEFECMSLTANSRCSLMMGEKKNLLSMYETIPIDPASKARQQRCFRLSMNMDEQRDIS